MGRIWMPGGGGSGADLDVITAASGDVLKNKVIIGPDGEPLIGSLELTGNAADSQVLAGKTYYNTDAKIKHTGAMVNQRAKSAALNCGGSYTIPEGYHNGSGKITANSLASQTDATAAAGHILSGKTAWVKGSKITGSMAVQSILSFSAAPYGVKQVVFTWKNPAKGPFSGVIIVYKTGSYPSSITDGTRIYKGSGSSSSANGISTAICTMPSENTTYYFRAFSYATQNNGEWVHSTTYTASATTIMSQYTFTSSGTLTIPNGSKVTVFLVGGGGGGACAYECNDSSGIYNGGGGGGGGYTKTYTFSHTGGKIYVTVGDGGNGMSRNLGNNAGVKSTPSQYRASDGGVSSIRYGSTTVTASGGKGGSTYSGSANTNCIGGNGGSGGGSGGYTNGTRSYDGWHGGSDGGNPSTNTYSRGMTQAIGQRTTTRAFGESSGTLYAGGGGGGAAGHWNCNNPKTKYPGNPGSGGSGGGGSAGGTGNMDGIAGSANTGGGGGGGRSDPDLASNISGQWSGAGGKGGSGIVLIRIQ